MFNPIFKGQLLRLAAAQADDYEMFLQWSNDDTYMRLLDDDPVRPRTTVDFDSLVGNTNDSYYFHLRTLDDDTLIGFVVLFNIKWASQTAMLAIGIGNTNYHGKGYGQDALRLILNYAFTELNLHRVGLSVMDYNTAAIKAYERVGFIKEGVQREMVQRNGKRYDMIFYGILQKEWLNASDNGK